MVLLFIGSGVGVRGQNLCDALNPIVLASDNCVDDNLPYCYCSNDPGGPYYFRLHIFIVTDADGTHNVNLTHIPIMVENLQRAFNRHNIYFVWDCELEFCSNHNVYLSGVTGASTGFLNAICGHQDGINIFVGDEESPDPNDPWTCIGNGNGGVVDNIPGRAIHISGKKCLFAGDPNPTDPVVLSSTVPHEMGHIFGLHHVTLANNCTQILENTDCQTSCDFVCDTPFGDAASNFPDCVPTNPLLPINSNLINFMSSNSHHQCKNTFTPEQGVRMRCIINEYLNETNINFAQKLIALPLLTTTNITTNTVFNTNQVMNGNIVINSGSELIIENCTIQMPWNAKIVVERNAKLTLNNAYLTAATCSEETELSNPFWQGIIVKGGIGQQTANNGLNNPFHCGIMRSYNNSVIEKALVGISAITTFEETTPGLLTISQTNFINNGNGVLMSAFLTPTTTASSFQDCIFVDNHHLTPNTNGIASFFTHSVLISRCRFTGFTQSGILGVNSGIEIEGGTIFDDNNFGIDMSNFMLGSPLTSWLKFTGSEFQRHLFDHNTSAHIRLDNTIGVMPDNFTRGALIRYTDFIGPAPGIFICNPSFYRIQECSFETENMPGIAGCSSGQPGDFQRFVLCNAFNNCDRAITFFGENRDVILWSNNFTNNSTDLLVTAYTDNTQTPPLTTLGAIYENQGSAGQPAGNCFSNPIINADIQALQGEVVPFKYYYEDVTPPPPCIIPITPGDYNVHQTIGNLYVCDQGAGIVYTNNDLQNQQTVVNNLTALVAANPQNEDYVAQLAAAELLYSQILQFLIGEAIMQNNYALAETYLLAEPPTLANQWLLYGIQVEAGNYQNASSTLAAMPNTPNYMLGVKTMQNWYLNWLQDTTGVLTLTPLQDSTLTAMANSPHIALDASMAQAFLRYFKNEYYPLQMPPMPLQNAKANPAQNHGIAQTNGLYIYPNPAANKLNISLQTINNTTNEVLQLHIVNLLGQMVYQIPVLNNNTYFTINTTNLQQGMYYVQVLGCNSVLAQSKLVINR